MARPAAGYKVNGQRVPGVTTIVGRFKESGALIRWAWGRGRDGLELYDSRDKAADIGTCVHAMVEAFVDGIDPLAVLETLAPKDDMEFRVQADSGYRAYKVWQQQSKLKIVAQEMSLTCECHMFGGTPDAIGEINDELCLIDWKTSNAVYTDMLIQIAAYKHLWEVNNPDRLLTGGYHLCRFAKSHGDFGHHFYPNLDEAWEQFTLLRQAYEIDKRLKKRAA